MKALHLKSIKPWAPASPGGTRRLIIVVAAIVAGALALAAWLAPQAHLQQVLPALAPCNACGVVELVREVSPVKPEQGGASPGTVFGYRMSGGGGEGFVALLGARQGRTLGRDDVLHEVDVRFGDGSVRTFRYAEAPAWRLGDRVRVIQGRLVPQA